MYFGCPKPTFRRLCCIYPQDCSSWSRKSIHYMTFKTLISTHQITWHNNPEKTFISPQWNLEFLIPIASLKISFSPTLHWHILREFSYGTSGSDRIRALVPRTTTFILSWCMHIQNNNITPMTTWYYIWHHVTNKFNPLNGRSDSLM
jgi:hypothetical protein